MTNFQAFRVYHENGGVVGRLETLSLDTLDSGDVLIQVSYSSINYKDALAVTQFGKVIRDYPRIPGIDLAGHVVDSKDKRFLAGDRVLVTGYGLGVTHDGGFAEYARVPADWIIPVPQNMSLFEAMAIGTAGFTVALSIQRLEDNHQTPDLGPLIVTGATGGVGSFAIDLLDGLGYEVIALTRKLHHHSFFNALGAKKILIWDDKMLSKVPLQTSQWGGAIDNIGGDVLSWLVSSVKPSGNIVSVGLAGSAKLNATVMPFILRGISLLGVTSSGCDTTLRKRSWERLSSDLAPRYINQIVRQTVSLNHLDRVFQQILSGEHVGRTVVAIKS